MIAEESLATKQTQYESPSVLTDVHMIASHIIDVCDIVDLHTRRVLGNNAYAI